MSQRTALTFDDANALLRYDAETGCLHWRQRAPRGRQRPNLRAGSDLKRDGKVLCRVVTVRGVRYREHHLIAFLQTSIWPEARRGRRAAATHSRSIAIQARPTPASVDVARPSGAAIATSKPATEIRPTPASVDLARLSRAAIAASQPAHRGWLFGLARRLNG